MNDAVDQIVGSVAADYISGRDIFVGGELFGKLPAERVGISVTFADSAGFRIPYACGHTERIEVCGKIKSDIFSVNVAAVFIHHKKILPYT